MQESKIPKNFLSRGLNLAVGQLRSVAKRLSQTAPPALVVTAIEGYDEYANHAERIHAERLKRRATERGLLRGEEPFHIDGYCYVCGRPTDFLGDYNHGCKIDRARIPNWRERVICRCCGLNNRRRAAVHLFGHFSQPPATYASYITEQATPVHR